MPSSVKRAAIVDAAYPLGSTSRGVSAQWLSWACGKAGIEVADTAHQVVLVTSVTPSDAPKIPRVKSRYKAPVIVGGAGALSPAAFIAHGADAVVLGDGTAFLRALAEQGLDQAAEAENCMTATKRDPTVDQTFDYSCPVFTSEDGVKRIIVSRGCKHKCLFCHTSWSLKFSEHDSPVVLADAARVVAASSRVGYITNDIGQHQFMKSLPASVDGSFSVDYLRKTGIPVQRQIRLGVEGVSERLRKLMRKPIANRDLVNCTAWLNSHGKGVRWFLIAGLPTETNQDWEELRDNVSAWKRICTKGVLELSFTAWCPCPSTPLAVMPIDDDYWSRFSSFREWFFNGSGWSNRVKLYAPQQPESRANKAALSMCCSERQLREGGAQGGNSRVRYPFEEACRRAKENLTGVK